MLCKSKRPELCERNESAIRYENELLSKFVFYFFFTENTTQTQKLFIVFFVIIVNYRIGSIGEFVVARCWTTITVNTHPVKRNTGF